MSSIFDSFTNKYSLSKTLRFELKPVGKEVDIVDKKSGEIHKGTMTEKLLIENKVFKKDETIDNSYHQAKFYFDLLHQRFIDSALSKSNVQKLPFKELGKFLENKQRIIANKKKSLNLAKRDKADKKRDTLQQEVNDIEKQIESKKKNFYKSIKTLFDAEAETWKKDYEGKTLEDSGIIKFSKSDKKQNGTKFLTAAGILKVLKFEFPKSKEKEFKEQGHPRLFVEKEEAPGEYIYIFRSFDNFSGYLSKFQQTRDNLYKEDGTSTAVSTRIVSNFEIYLANKKTFEDKYKSTYKQIGFGDISIFEVANYYKYLLQKGIEAIESSKVSDTSYNKVIGSINKLIKEFRDKKASEAKEYKEENFKKTDYPLFKTLEKQILGKVEKERQLIVSTETKTAQEVFVERFKEFIEQNEIRFPKAREVMDKFIANEFEAAYENIFIKNSTINTIRKWFADPFNFERSLPQTSNNRKEADTPKVKKFISLADLRGAIETLEGQAYKQNYYDDKVTKTENTAWDNFLAIWDSEFNNLFEDRKGAGNKTNKGYNSYLQGAKELSEFSKKESEIRRVKNYADASLRIFQMMQYLTLEEKARGNLTGIDTNFYAELDDYAKDFEFIKYYNAFRNFITKKPFNEKKLKLNFEKNPPILKGFSKQYSSYLLKKTLNGKAGFYLAILKNGNLDDSKDITNLSDYSYFPASQLKFQNLVNKSFKDRFGYIYSENRDDKKAIQDAQTYIKERHLIKYPALKPLIENKFQTRPEFTKAVNHICTKIYSANSFISIDRSQIEGKLEAGELYLFQIINKDDSPYRLEQSNKNLHSIYFEQLFEKMNLTDPVLKISGGSEMFSRDLTTQLKKEKKHILTKANQKDITEYLNKKYEIEKYSSNRYLSRKYFLHLSIEINYGKPKSPSEKERLIRFAGAYNKEIRQSIVAKKEINVIGIDRGEKHLLFYSVVNQKGQILEQGSLNEINRVNYHEKLVAREKERLENRRSWQSVAGIKDLKKGYISNVIHKICNLIIKYQAIVVLEDLNMRFKQIRGGIERSIYQQFEKALIDKLGYLVFKDRSGLRTPGGALKGYQLTAPFVSFEKMGKQTGILFYTQADYTSVTDPLTGFRKNIYISNSASAAKISESIKKFKAIGWDKKEGSYFFQYNPADFTEEKYKSNTYSKEWIVYTKVSRIIRQKDINGYWQCKPVDLNDKFRRLFLLWEFENPEGDILEQIQMKEQKKQLKGVRALEGKQHGFYQSFIYLFNLILQIRNSFSEQWSLEQVDGKSIVKRVGEEIDFIASPVKPFFSTLAVSKSRGELSPDNFSKFSNKYIGKEKEKFHLDYNGDANGAYNIARKGIIILERIVANPQKPDLYISKFNWAEWLDERGF